MIFGTVLPYFLAVAGLSLGIGLGWFLHHHHTQRQSAPQPEDLDARIQALKTLAENKRLSIRQAEAMIAQMDLYLSTLNRDISHAREQLHERDHEHTRLLMALDERRASVEDAQSNLHQIRQKLQSREQEAETLLTDIDKSIEELDMLNDLKESYLVKINRLTQQVQWQDSELRMLQQTIRTKTAEIDEARALLDQRDAELRRVIRQRQQREIDLAHARQLLTQRDEELRQLLDRQHRDDQALDATTRSNGAPANRIDVTPHKRASLPPGPAVEIPAADEEDDLTQLPGLAEFYAAQLRAQGIRSFKQLAFATPEQIEQMLRFPGHFSPDISGWIQAAQQRLAARQSGM